MAAPTNAANVKKALANAEPSTRKRARAENAQNCFLSFLLSTVTARAVLFLFNVIERKFLRASSRPEFSHNLGPSRHSLRRSDASGVGREADMQGHWPTDDAIDPGCVKTRCWI
jgi:hypothetical protein